MSTQKQKDKKDKEQTEQLYQEYQNFLIELDKIKKEAQKVCASYAKKIDDLKNKKIK